MSDVIWIEHKRDGTKKITRKNYDTGEVEDLSGYTRVEVRAGKDGYWRTSLANGVPNHQLEEAKRIDQELGVPIDYINRGFYSEACFNDHSQEIKWMTAQKRVNLDPGYRDPCPGDFVKD